MGIEFVRRISPTRAGGRPAREERPGRVGSAHFHAERLEPPAAIFASAGSGRRRTVRASRRRVPATSGRPPGSAAMIVEGTSGAGPRRSRGASRRACRSSRT